MLGIPKEALLDALGGRLPRCADQPRGGERGGAGGAAREGDGGPPDPGHPHRPGRAPGGRACTLTDCCCGKGPPGIQRMPPCPTLLLFCMCDMPCHIFESLLTQMSCLHSSLCSLDERLSSLSTLQACMQVMVCSMHADLMRAMPAATGAAGLPGESGGRAGAPEAAGHHGEDPEAGRCRHRAHGVTGLPWLPPEQAARSRCRARGVRRARLGRA